MAKRARLGKKERAAKRARLQAEASSLGLVSMCTSVSYGASCMASLHDFRPGAKRWGYDGRKASVIHRRK